MQQAQRNMYNHLGDSQLAEVELEAIKEYHLKHRAQREFLSQQVKLAWIKYGDENTSLLHQSIKARKLQNHVYGIHDEHGNWKDTTENVSHAFLSYYENLLSRSTIERKFVISQLIQEGPMITYEHRHS